MGALCELRDAVAVANGETEYRYAPIEFRQDGDSPGIVSGDAVRYGDVSAAPFRDTFRAGAFGDLGDADVIANISHDRNRPLARTGGGGLTLSDSERALTARIELPSTADGRDAATLLRRGVLRGLSIEFVPLADAVEHGVRTISEARLVGLAIVDKPAFPQSVPSMAREHAANRRERRVGRRWRSVW